MKENMFSTTEPLLFTDAAAVADLADVDVTTNAVATPDFETATAAMPTPTSSACSSADQPSNCHAQV